jgi:hypothetical protein
MKNIFLSLNKIMIASFLGICLSSMYVAAEVRIHENLDSKSALELGTALETNFWNNVKDNDVKHLSKTISQGFQGISPYGVEDRAQKIAELASSTLQSFELLDIIVTTQGNNLIITYNFIATESNLTNGLTISVWKREGDCWKMISHSYTPPIPI